MENHFTLDPYYIFNLKYVFEIQDLDSKYYALYKTYYNTSELNLAYEILKDPLKRAAFLCDFFGFNKKNESVIKEVFEIIKRKDDCSLILSEIFNSILAEAELGNFLKVSYLLQKHSYLNSLMRKKI